MMPDSPAVPPRRASRPARLAALAIAAVAALTVVLASRHFNQIFDEGAHIASGMTWLVHGTYQYDPQHTPLGRIAIALGPYLDGARGQLRRTQWDEGNAILLRGDRYAHTLTLARLGNLPFLLLLLAATWWWARWRYDERTATLAVLLAAAVPSVLAQFGIATTDAALTGTLMLACYAFVRWFDRPSWRATALLALGAGLSLSSKLSTLPYLGLAIVLIVLARLVLGDRAGHPGESDRHPAESDRHPGESRDPSAPASAGATAVSRPDPAPPEPPASRVRWPFRALRGYVVPAVVALAGAGFVVWAVYRFHISWARGGRIPVPAPEFLAGIRELAAHNAGGQATYLFGRVSQFGWWYFPLVELLFKTPLAFMALVGTAIGLLARERARVDWRALAPYLAALAILLTAMFAHIDLGVRHIILIYPLLAIPASGAVMHLWRRAPRPRVVRTALAALVCWQVAATARAYPDFLADFNALIGSHPDHVFVDSNLDWGQDLRLLADTLHARHVNAVSLFYFGSTPVGAFHLADTVRIGGPARATGWVAVSRTYLQGDYVSCFTWLRDYTPVARVGNGMLLYRLLPDTTPRLPAGTVPVSQVTEPYGVMMGTSARSTQICAETRALIHGGTAALAPDVTQQGDAAAMAAAGSAGADARAPSGVSSRMLLDAAGDPANWLTYGRDYTNRRYSPLDQLDTRTVSRLTVAWVHQLEAQPGGQETSPVEVDGTLYYTGPFGAVVAVDARTGRELWRHQHKLAPVPTCCGAKNRGVAVYGTAVYVSTLDDHLLALDNRTGSVLWDVELANPDSAYSMTSAPLAVDGKIIVGVAGSDFAMRGFVDAYDAATGTRLWRFYTIPSPEQGGWWGKWSLTTPDGDRLPRDITREKRDSARYADAWRLGGGGVWNTPSYDPALHTIYLGVGNPAPNMDGSVRPGDNLYTTSVVALDVDTGRLRWYYQEIPHDLWDYDASNPTVLLTVMENGQEVPAVAQAGKVGWVYILDRRTGRRIRRSAPFVPHENTFTAPTAKGVRIMPGMGGGANNAPPSFSPRTGLLYVSGIVEPITYTLQPQEMEIGTKYEGGRFIPAAPATGTLTAIDVNSGNIRWQTPTAERMLGTGSLATAGDLVFYAEQQGLFHAADARTGKILWTAYTGGHVRAPPITYELDGRQYVAIAAGDALFAFALPPR